MKEIPKVVVLIETSWEYGRGFLRGIARYARLQGPWALYIEPEGQERIKLPLDKWGANGIIVQLDETKKVKKTIPRELPAIAFLEKEEIPKEMPGLPNIIGDWDATGKMAAEHLLERGFRHFAYCGFRDMSWSRKREEGFRKKIAEAGFKTYSSAQPRSKVRISWQKEQALMADWLKSLPKPIGLMACDDERSRDVIEACKIANLHVPDEVAIIGVDNDDLICNISYPQLSSIALNTERAGYEAAELLDKLMAGKEKMTGQSVFVRPLYAVTRQSTDILAMEDREVAKAVHFIREHAKDTIQVDDVVKVVTMSRRVLERRFRKVLKRSILDEIRRVRINLMAQMLVETNLSVSQIAFALNYHGFEHVARSFRQEKGVSPLAYRRKYGIK